MGDYGEDGRPLFVGEKVKPKNCPDMRSMREAMNDPRYQARKTRVNNSHEADGERR